MSETYLKNIGSFILVLGVIIAFSFPITTFIFKMPELLIPAHGLTGLVLVLIAQAIIPRVSEREEWIKHCKKNKVSKEVRQRGLSYM